MQFHVIIPVFNRLPLTTRCLTSLSAQTDRRMRITLVDDGSTDGTAETVCKNFPEVDILTGDGHLWWTGAVNLGLQHVLRRMAPDDYVLLINNDTYFDQNFIACGRAAVQRYPDALIGGVLVDAPASRSFCCASSRT